MCSGEGQGGINATRCTSGEGQGGINATRCTSAVVKVKKASMLQDVPVQCSGDLDYIFHHIKICLSLYNSCIKTFL